MERAVLVGNRRDLRFVSPLYLPIRRKWGAPTAPSASSYRPATIQTFKIGALRMEASCRGAAGDVISETARRFQVNRMDLFRRTLKRGLEDQKELYSAPFKVLQPKVGRLGSLAGTGAFLATDRRIEKTATWRLFFSATKNGSNIALGGLSAALAGLWIYGIKTDKLACSRDRKPGAGKLLTNTFLIYAPHAIHCRQATPGARENGNGDFLAPSTR